MTGLRRRMLCGGLALMAGITLTAATATASSAKPFTFTLSTKYTDSFTGTFPCQGGERYTVTVTGHLMFHLTDRGDPDGNFVPPLRLTVVDHAKAVATPVDGTGPSFVGHFHDFDLETIRSVKHGTMIVEVDTDRHKMFAKGSDGSFVRIQEHHHFTVNANGDVTVDFEKAKASC